MSQRPRETKREARERKVAERLQAEQAAARRRRVTTIAAVVSVVVIVLAAVVIGVLSNRNSGSDATASPTVLGSSAANVKVDLWEDPQCPFCAQFESVSGEYVAGLITGNKAQVSYHTVTFLDRNFPGDHSLRAANALKCAENEGTEKFLDFHTAIFANQPAQEGTGWTDDQLLTMARDSGITSDSFKRCVSDLTYEKQVKATTDSMTDAGVGGTPAVFVNGKEIKISGGQTVQDLLKKLQDAVAAASK